MKRELSDENEGGNGATNKRNRRNDDMVRLLIPSRIAGAVIGKGGQHIQKMRSQYKATVSVDDCQGPERTILISCDLESLLSTVKEVLKYFEEKDDEVDVRMLIHQSLAGCVIGKGGTKIKEIRDKIGCRILKVFSNVAPQSTDRIVQIVGKQDQCVEAVREVLDVTRDTPIKGAVHNYDPINFDDLFADEYGGYGGMPNGGGGGMGGGMRGGGRQSRFDRRDGGRRFGGNGGGGDRGRRDDRSRSDDRRDREYINPWANDGPLGGRSSNMGGGGGFGSSMGGGFGGSGGFGSGFGGGQGGGFGGGSSGGFGGSGGTFGTGGGPSFGSGAGGNGNFGSGSGGNFGSGGGGVFGSGSGMGGNNLGNGTSGGGMSGGSIGGGNMGNAGGGGGGGGGFGGGMNNGGPGGDNKNSTQVTIPKDLAGAIIGKGGGRIRRIRNESGAYITIDEPLPGSNDRIITISGNPKQIQMAQYLLQQSVHENRRKF